MHSWQFNVHAATIEKFQNGPASPGVSLKVAPRSKHMSNRANIQIMTSGLLGILTVDRRDSASPERYSMFSPGGRLGASPRGRCDTSRPGLASRWRLSSSERSVGYENHRGKRWQSLILSTRTLVIKFN